MTRRQEQVGELIRTLAGEYFARESNRTSLMTVTRVSLSPNLRAATVSVSVFPAGRGEEVLGFLQRHGAALRDYLKERSALKIIPHLNFELDPGEQNRERIDKLLKE